MFDIKIYGDPVLRKTAQPVTVFDSSLKNFLTEMTETMIEKDGVGLAAPQVGESVRIAVIDVTGGEKEPLVLINPEFIEKSEELEEAEEGCLSVPGIHLNITRPKTVSVRAFDSEGKEFFIKDADGLLARALQHETDHLNGIMIVDHISALQKKMLSTKLKKLNKTGRDTSEIS
ncbi:MAG: peptide deformylase [Chitinispirillaceae bacterium]|nr:peptide deformylase [Chitinispirillaceae bacterium]